MSCTCSDTPGAASSRTECQSWSHRSLQLHVSKSAGDALLCHRHPKNHTRALAQPKSVWISSNPAADSKIRVGKCQKGPLRSQLPLAQPCSDIHSSCISASGPRLDCRALFFWKDSSSSVLKDLKGGESATSVGKVIALPIKKPVIYFPFELFHLQCAAAGSGAIGAGSQLCLRHLCSHRSQSTQLLPCSSDSLQLPGFEEVFPVLKFVPNALQS